MTSRIRHRLADERGVALVVIMGVLMVLSLISAALLTTALSGKVQSKADRNGKQAYAAAVAGVRSAVYWLNASVPDDTACPPLPGLTSPLSPNADNVCGPYESDNQSGVSGATTQPMVNTRFTYWITPTLNTDPTSPNYNDICTGSPPRVLNGRRLHVADRCVTAIGQALAPGGRVLATKRVQTRVSAAQVLFPIPGVWGTSCVTVGGSANAGSTTCDAPPSGVSSSSYTGALGSNGTTGTTVNGQLVGIAGATSCWIDDPAAAYVPPNCNSGLPSGCSPNCPANLYLGNQSPANATVANYILKIGNMTNATSPAPSGSTLCSSGGGSVTYCTGTTPALPYSGNAIQKFGRYFTLPRVGDYFAKPPDLHVFTPTTGVNAGQSVSRTTYPPALVVACSATTDTSTCNDDASLAVTMNTGGVNNCSGTSLNTTTRALAVGSGCTLYLPNGTYNFCSISLAQDSRVKPAAPPSGYDYQSAEARVFLDNSTRTVGASPACSSSLTNVGKLTTSGTGAHVPTWMTTATPPNSNSTACAGQFTNDAAVTATTGWTALAGQLFVYGAGDPDDTTSDYPPKVGSLYTGTQNTLDIPSGMMFNGLVEAPNSTVNLTGAGICMHGGLAAGQVNVASNAGFVWDPIADTATGSTDRTFYRTAFSVCSAQTTTWTGTPAYPAHPMDGC